MHGAKIIYTFSGLFWLFLVIYLPILLSGNRMQFNIDKKYTTKEYKTINDEIQTYIKANSDITRNKNRYKKLLTVSLLQDIKMGDHCRTSYKNRNISIKLAVGTFIVVKFNKKLYFVNELHLEKRNKKKK